MELFSLQGQTALVTGGAKGIGKGIATVLRRAGADVIIADIDREHGEATAAVLGGHYQPLDVRVQDSCRAAIAAAVARFGALDILCSNTGIFPQKTLAEMNEADWDETHGINLKGTFFMVQAAAEAMRPRGYGRIVITSSITGPVTGFPGWSHYGASKAGQLGFMRSAALEYARFGITINAVMPGNDAHPRHAGRHRLRRLLPRQPRSRLHHRTDDYHRRRANPAGIGGGTAVSEGKNPAAAGFFAVRSATPPCHNARPFNHRR